MGKRAMQEMLLLDHQDRALSGRLAQMFMPLLQAALVKQLWEISTNRQEMSAHLRDLLETLREVDLARHSLREKEEKAQEALMRLMRGKNIEVPLSDPPEKNSRHHGRPYTPKLMGAKTLVLQTTSADGP